MRLIDADKIEYDHCIARSLDDGHNWNELCATKDQIVDMETVDAIPVAWLKEYANKHLYNSAYSIVMGIINKRKWEEVEVGEEGCVTGRR